MSAKFDKFKNAFVALCAEHQIILITSDYEFLEIEKRVDDGYMGTLQFYCLDDNATNEAMKVRNDNDR